MKFTMKKIVTVLLVAASVLFVGSTINASLKQPPMRVADAAPCYTAEQWVKDAQGSPFPGFIFHEWFTYDAMAYLKEKGVIAIEPNAKATLAVFVLPDITAVMWIFGADKCQMGDPVPISNQNIIDLDALARKKSAKDANNG